ncbi:MAG: hypothetical protein PHC51_01815 [bacterium]|nr:hypothetical protein [bacterium]
MKGFLYYLVLFAICGLGPVYYFRKTLGNPRLIAASFFAVIFGSSILNAVVLTAGHFGYLVTGRNLHFYGLATAAISVFYLMFGLWRPISVRSCSSPAAELKNFPEILGRITLGDLLVTLILAVFYGYLVAINFTFYFPKWDHFTYWMIDAKSIYESGYLRKSADLINIFSYTSYYPLHAVYLFDFYGRTVEQCASLFTLMYAVLGSFIAYYTVKQTSFSSRILAGFILFVVATSFSEQLVTFYADVVSAYSVALFFFFLLREPVLGEGGKRLFLIVSSLLLLAAIKSTNVYYVAILFVVWLACDLRPASLKKFLDPKEYAGTHLFSLLLVIVAGRFYYLKYVWNIKLENSPLIVMNRLETDPFKYLVYIDHLFDFLLEQNTIMCLLVVIAVYQITLYKSLPKPSLAILSAILLLPSLNLAHYVLTQYGLQSLSILRYVTTVFFLLPMYFTSLPTRPAPRFYFGARNICMLGWVIVMFYGLVRSYSIVGLPIHSGSYEGFTYQKTFADISRDIKAIVGKERLLIAGNDSDIYVGNMRMTELPLRYYLSENSVAGLYRVPKGRFLDKLRGTGVEFLLVTTYNDALMQLLNLETTPAGVSLYKLEPGDLEHPKLLRTFQ